MAKLILFAGPEYTGGTVIVDESKKELTSLFINDHVQSVIVASGKWLLYEDDNYGGDSLLVTSDQGPDKDGCYPTPEYLKAAGGISSVKLVP